MYDKVKRISYISIIPILFLIFFSSIEPAKAYYIPGQLSGNETTNTDNNGNVEIKNPSQGEQIQPEIIEELGIPKNELITAYTSLYNKKPSCESLGLSSVPPSENQIDALIVPEALKTQLKIRLRNAISTSKNIGDVCYSSTLSLSNSKFKDTSQKPHAWKWKAYTGLNGIGDASFKDKYGANALIWGNPVTHFDGYSPGKVQDMIDEGYFDMWINNYSLLNRKQLIEARKDLIASNIAEAHYKPKDYPEETIGWYDTDFTEYSIMMNHNTWYKQEVYKQMYYAYNAKGYLVYALPNVKQTEDLITNYEPTLGKTTLKRKTPIYKKVLRSGNFIKGTWKYCDAIQETTNKCETKQWYDSIIDHYEYEYATEQFTSYAQGLYNQEVSYTLSTKEVAEWEYVNNYIGYITLSDNIPKKPDKNVCDYVPNITGEGCRILYRDGTLKKGLMGDISKEKALEACKCLPMHNLTD